MSKEKAIDFEYDPRADLATIAGVEWSGDLLRSLRNWTHHPEELPPFGYLLRIVKAEGALPYGVRFERVDSFDRLVEKAEHVYQIRQEVFEDPNAVHRAIKRMGFALNEVRGLK